MKKIIHLTDTHLGYENLSTRMGAVIDRMINTIDDPADYIVVHTGDLIEDATVDNAYNEAIQCINRIKSAGFTFLCIPGNHDYGTGYIGFKQYVSLFKKHIFGDINITYPKIDIIEEIAFIGLDSMAEELNWYDRISAEGELGEEQLLRLKTSLEENEQVTQAKFKVIYLHHHPFHPEPFNYLKDSDQLGLILKEHQIDALLFGHNHYGKKWNGEWNINRVYDGGTSTGKDDMPCPHRVIDLSKDPDFDYDAEFGG